MYKRQYQNSEPDPNLRAGADTLMIQDEFGQQNAVVVLVPRGDVAAEAALSRDLAEVDHVTDVISYASTVGAAIPQGFLDQSVIDQFYSPNYARIIAYTSTDVESDEAFSTVEAVQQAAARHYDTYYTAGQSANLYDLKNIVAVDNEMCIRDSSERGVWTPHFCSKRSPIRRCSRCRGASIISPSSLAC